MLHSPRYLLFLPPPPPTPQHQVRALASETARLTDRARRAAAAGGSSGSNNDAVPEIDWCVVQVSCYGFRHVLFRCTAKAALRCEQLWYAHTPEKKINAPCLPAHPQHTPTHTPTPHNSGTPLTCVVSCQHLTASCCRSNRPLRWHASGSWQQCMAAAVAVSTLHNFRQCCSHSRGLLRVAAAAAVIQVLACCCWGTAWAAWWHERLQRQPGLTPCWVSGVAPIAALAANVHWQQQLMLVSLCHPPHICAQA